MSFPGAGGGDRLSMAALFPGQGTRPSRREATAHRADLVAALDEILQRDAFAEAAESTACAQPAVYCASLALWSAAGRPPAHCFAGHSLGEITALAAAGWIDELDGLRLVVRRGALMQEACDRAAGGMLALFDVPRALALTLAQRFGLALASDNCPGQLVFAGEIDGLDALAEELDGRSLVARRLPVAGAFHSPLMQPAVAPFKAAVEEVRVSPRSREVLSATTLAPFRQPAEELSASLVNPVRWREALLALWQQGIEAFAATGPGKALRPMVERTLPQASMR